MKFEITPEEQAKIDVWAAEQTKKFLAQNDMTIEDKSFLGGAIGGRLTYKFTPTSLGVAIAVHDALTNEELDLTDYASW